MIELFTRHPQSVGETYFEHLGMAASFAGHELKTADDGTFAFEGLGAGVVSLRMTTGEQYSRESLGHGGVLAKVEAGRDTDLGDVQLVSDDPVDEAERGTLGLQTEPAVAAPSDGEHKWEADVPGAEAALWISRLDPRGPAAAAGLAVGERVVALDGVTVGEVGPMALDAMLGDKRLRRGQAYALTVLGAEGERTVEITAVAPLPGPG